MTLRFDPIAYEVVANEARASGVTVAQFVREAALIRAYCRACVAEDPSLTFDRRFVRLMAEVSEAVARHATVGVPIAEG